MAVHLAVAVDAFDGVLFVLCVRATEVLLYNFFLSTIVAVM